MKKDIDNRHSYDLIAVFALAILCIIIYSNSLNSPFVFDDLGYIKENNTIRLTHLDLDQLCKVWTKRSFGLNRPVARVSFALNYYFGGYEATGYHIVNIVIHLINGILVYFLALLIFRQLCGFLPERGTVPEGKVGKGTIQLMALFAALFFVAHPLQTEAVTYICQRMTSMAAMFYFLAFLLYILGRLSRTRRRRWWLWGACVASWLLSVRTKEVAATLPFIIALYEWYFFQDLSREWFRRNLKYAIVLIVILVLLAFVYLGAHPIDRILVSYETRDFSMWQRLLTQFRVVVSYMGLLLYPNPSRLTLLHHVTPSRSLFDPATTLLSAMIIAGFIGLAVFIAKRNRLISFCILWFFVNLVIESSVFGLEMMYEHRVYLPMFGLALIIPYLVFYLLRNSQLWATVICAFIIIFLAIGTYVRNKAWHDELTFWSDVISKNPQSFRAENNLGNTLAIRRKVNEAIAHYIRALQINPDYAEAHNNLGAALFRKGKIEEAIFHFQEALRLMPKFTSAEENLKKATAAKKKFDDAFAKVQEQLRLRPEDPALYCTLGNLYRKKGELDEAISQYQKALMIQPEYIQALQDLGVVYAIKGEYEKAISLFGEIIELQPDAPGGYYNIACLYARQNKVGEAVDWLKKAVQKGYKNWHLIKNDKDLANIRRTTYYRELVGGH